MHVVFANRQICPRGQPTHWVVLLLWSDNILFPRQNCNCVNKPVFAMNPMQQDKKRLGAISFCSSMDSVKLCVAGCSVIIVSPENASKRKALTFRPSIYFSDWNATFGQYAGVRRVVTKHYSSIRSRPPLILRFKFALCFNCCVSCAFRVAVTSPAQSGS